MPGLYATADYDLAGFCVGAAERGRLLPREDIAPGDAIIGVMSSGVHSNGFSLVRKIVQDHGLGWDAPAPFEHGVSLGEALLRPTRIYVRAAMAAIARAPVKALAHITGGGLPGNLPRVLPEDAEAVIDLGAWTMPPVFRWLAEAGSVPQSEMLRTFNCGIGFAAVASKEAASDVVAAFTSEGEQAALIGEIRARQDASGPGISFRGEPDF
jgi:phosphoribosylformylglycinamidine cyclo-ligase